MAESESQTSTRTTFQPDSDVHITLEDQRKINYFARYNAKHDDIKAELKAKQNELQKLEDAAEELLLLDDETTGIPFLTGEVFVYLNADDTNKALEAAKSKILSEMTSLQETGEELKSSMSQLKMQLYAKFGNHINLEGEEE